MQKNGQPPSSAIVGLMAKYWQPGRVKTRLGASIGMDQAASLHQLFVHQLLRELGIPILEKGRGEDYYCGEEQNCVEEQHWTLQWAVSPPETMDQCRQQVADWNLNTVSIADQGEGDLGDRMGRWLHKCCQSEHKSCVPDPQSNVDDSGYAKAILIGADCPLLNRSDIVDALQRLDRFDAVLGPAVDGGYYLVGLKSPPRHDFQRIFTDMVWSREDVFDVTRERMKEIGMTVSILPTREDVDTQSELIRLRQSLADPGFDHDKATKRLRDEIDRVTGTFNET